MGTLQRRESCCYVLVLIFIPGLIIAIPNPEEKRQRVLSNLSDKKHYQDEGHNRDYDHEAFLGEDAETFDQLTPEESKRRLSVIIDHIDKDKDGKITHGELKDWIQYTQTKYISNDVDKQWKTHVVPGKSKLTWDEYRKTVYGFSHDYEAVQVDKEEESGGYSFKSMLDRDKRRWSFADVDGDGALTHEEFSAFLHPEETSHMKELVILETMEDIDKNKDGRISLEEYVGDMYPSVENEKEMPEWVRNEKEQFAAYRDKDGDGFMDVKEMRDWIFPEGFDPAEAEARHLLFESDSDGDQKLTKDEILDKYDLFVGSQATDFGEALTRHDEF